MSFTLRIFLIIGILFYLCFILNHLRRKNLNIRYAIGWILSALLMLLITIFPQIIAALAALFGVVDVTNLVFALEGCLVLLVLISMTAYLSAQNEADKKLVQTIAILEKRVRELEEKTKHKEV